VLTIDPVELLKDEIEPRPKTIGVVIAGCATSQHRQQFVDVLRLLVAGNGGARRVGLFNEVVSVVSETMVPLDEDL